MGDLVGLALGRGDGLADPLGDGDGDGETDGDGSGGIIVNVGIGESGEAGF